MRELEPVKESGGKCLYGERWTHDSRDGAKGSRSEGGKGKRVKGMKEIVKRSS